MQLQINATQRRQSSRVAREYMTSPSKRTFTVENQKRDAVRKTFESILNSPEELTLFKAFLHVEYGIALWDLWRSLEWYEALRTAPDRKTEELLVLAGKFYDRYLAPDAKCFVEDVPSGLALAVAESLDRNEVPVCDELHNVVSNALCDEGMMQRFGAWLHTEEARREAAQAELASSRATIGSDRSSLDSAQFRRSSVDENFIRRASNCGDLRHDRRRSSLLRNHHQDQAASSTKVSEGLPDESGDEEAAWYRESFRGSFDIGDTVAADDPPEITLPSSSSSSKYTQQKTPRTRESSRFLYDRDKMSEQSTPKTPLSRLPTSSKPTWDDGEDDERRRRLSTTSTASAPAPARSRVLRFSQEVMRRRSSGDSTSLDDWSDASFQIPTSRGSNKSFGLTSILMQQWEEDQDTGYGVLSEHPMLIAPSPTIRCLPRGSSGNRMPSWCH